MPQTAEAYEKVLEMVLQTKEKTRKILDGIPGMLEEPEVPVRNRVNRPNARTPSTAFPASTQSQSSMHGRVLDENSKPVRISFPEDLAKIPSTPAAKSQSSDTSSDAGRVDEALGERRLYRTLDKKHVVVLQKINLKKPMSDEEMADLEKQLQAQTTLSEPIDYVPSLPNVPVQRIVL